MKKKIIALVLVVCMMAVCFAGCDQIIKKNDRRDFEQAIATVEYQSKVNGQDSSQVSKIMKGEFALSFNSNAQQYVQYYGMSYSQAGNYIMNSLTQRELMTLFAKSYVINNKVDGLDVKKLPEDCEIVELLTRAEQDKAIKATNKDLRSALESLISNLIAEDEKNKHYAEEAQDVVEDSSKDEVTFRVLFDSDGGSKVASLKVGKNKLVVKPFAPTKQGYTFGGWKYSGGTKDGEWFDFQTDKITAKTTLKAVWYKYTSPRPVREEKKEEVKEDFDPLETVEKLTPYFFSDEYQEKDNGYLDFEDEKFWDYRKDALAQLNKNLASTFRGYDYYLGAQMKTILLEKFERDVYSEAVNETGYEQKVQAEYERIIAQNQESFAMSDGNYKSALEESLAATYYHKYTDKKFGFTNNILLRFSDEDMKTLTKAIAFGTSTEEQIRDLRDSMAQNMDVLVSNPKYDKYATCDDHDCPDSRECDPMTCPNHECNSTPDKNSIEDYNSMISFEYSEEDGWHIKHNVDECPTMAYLKTQWPAFDDGEKIGVVNQIKNTLDSVVAATEEDAEHRIAYTESIYWIREVTQAWLYLVGDDAGGTNAESNNGGLGYLMSGEGESGYIIEYETHARALIQQGSGSYSVDETNEFYVIGDNCIETKNSDLNSAYAGIFVVVISEVPYDTNFYTKSGGEGVMKDGVLPLDYVVEVAKDATDNVTIYDNLYDSILEGRKNEIYSILINDFMGEKLEGHTGTITVDEKIYNAFFKQ